MTDAGDAAEHASDHRTEAPARVRRRRVYYISGFDPQGPRRYHQLYRSESQTQAEISGYEIDVGRLDYEAGGTAAFGAALAVARMERASEDEAAEAIWAVTGGRQRACEF